MWQAVFEASRATAWRMVVLLSLVFWGSVMMLVASCTPAHAQVKLVAEAGADYWHAPTEPARYLPNYATPNPWKSVTPWARAQVQHQTDTDIGLLTLTASGKTDPVFRGRVDRLDADLRLGMGGTRLGILPYRLSWCRPDGGPWMAEPDAFCRFAGLKEISEGAFGAQAYRSGLFAGMLIDIMAGVYRPMVDGQNEKLGPYVAVGPTVKHHAHGASINAVHLATGIEARAGWLRTEQDQDSTAGSYQRRLRYNSYYFGLQGNINQHLDLRASLSGYMGNQINPAQLYAWDGRSHTLELIYKPGGAQSIAAGLSRYSNVTTYAIAPNGQNLQVDSLSLAWRKDWPHGLSTTVQASRSLDDGTTRRGVLTERQGSAYGLRVSKVF